MQLEVCLMVWFVSTTILEWPPSGRHCSLLWTPSNCCKLQKTVRTWKTLSPSSGDTSFLSATPSHLGVPVSERLTTTYDGHSDYNLWLIPFRYFSFWLRAQCMTTTTLMNLTVITVLCQHGYNHARTTRDYNSLFMFCDWVYRTDQSYHTHLWTRQQRVQSVTE